MCYIYLQVCDEPVAYMYDTPGKHSWCTTLPCQGGHVGGQYNINISSRSYIKVKFSS